MVTPQFIISGVSQSPGRIYETKLVNADESIEKENPMSMEYMFVCMWSRLAVGKKDFSGEQKWQRNGAERVEEKRGK